MKEVKGKEKEKRAHHQAQPNQTQTKKQKTKITPHSGTNSPKKTQSLVFILPKFPFAPKLDDKIGMTKTKKSFFSNIKLC